MSDSFMQEICSMLDTYTGRDKVIKLIYICSIESAKFFLSGSNPETTLDYNNYVHVAKLVLKLYHKKFQEFHFHLLALKPFKSSKRNKIEID